MNLTERITAAQAFSLRALKQNQQEDGSFVFCFESGPMTDAYMLLLLSSFHDNKTMIRALQKRLITSQSIDGYWKQFPDDKGHLSSTIEAYVALLLSGGLDKEAPAMKAAASYILQNGGVENAHISTKFMLALHKLYPWPARFPIPLFVIGLPRWLPLSFHQLSSYVRTHFAPMLILGHSRFSLDRPNGATIDHLYVSQKCKKLTRQKAKKTSGFKRHAYKKAEQYMLSHIEEDGTLHSYASATLFMVYAMLALGYKADSPLIKQAIKGLIGHIDQVGTTIHLQNSPSLIWDTALAASAMQAAGSHSDDPSFQKATDFLLEQRHAKNGGWGFSKSNSIHPDVDDTQAALRALTPFAHKPHYQTAWRTGIRWLLERQNQDGGWAAFEKNSRSSLVRLLKLQNLADTALDPSAADLTGRTIEFLSRNVRMNHTHPTISKGINWLVRHQQANGSWKGRWGISYIYGTWASVTGMRAAELPSSHPSIVKAISWLESVRLPDLGWGESCSSDTEDHFVPLTYSTVVHTAWALDTLVAVHERPTLAMQQTLSQLLKWMQEESKRTIYPTGAGLPGQFYIHYHSYRYIWPLVAISHYAQKYEHTQIQDEHEISPVHTLDFHI